MSYLEEIVVKLDDILREESFSLVVLFTVPDVIKANISFEFSGSVADKNVVSINNSTQFSALEIVGNQNVDLKSSFTHSFLFWRRVNSKILALKKLHILLFLC